MTPPNEILIIQVKKC